MQESQRRRQRELRGSAEPDAVTRGRDPPLARRDRPEAAPGRSRVSFPPLRPPAPRGEKQRRVTGRGNKTTEVLPDNMPPLFLFITSPYLAKAVHLHLCASQMRQLQ